MDADYIVVGSGLTGSVIARVLTDHGCRVLVLDRRPHIGGNVFDRLHDSGIRIHEYGPHFFRTSSDRIWAFVNRFSSFYKFEAAIKTHVDGRLENWPIANECVKRIGGVDWAPEFTGTAQNFEQQCLSKMPRLVYEKFIKGYTQKQWGVTPDTLLPSLAKRFHVRQNNDTRLALHPYQGLPVKGYGALIANMLSKIDVTLNCDYLKYSSAFRAKVLLIYTGPIDEFFGFKFGRLRYRGQRRELFYLDNTDRYQAHAVINYPSLSVPEIRVVEWKHTMEPHHLKKIHGTLITKEIPIAPVTSDNFEYPFPDKTNQDLYQVYKQHAERIPNLLVCGRLGEFRYYDMDQAIGRALTLSRGILARTPGISHRCATVGG